MAGGGKRGGFKGGSAAMIAVLASLGVETRGADCNRNGVGDALDVAPDRMGFVLSRRYVLPDVGAPVAVADFDGDEIADVAGRAAVPGDVRVCRSGARGLEAACTTLSTGADVFALASGDLDGDQDPD